MANKNSSQGTMHGAAPPFMPGWPPLSSHELYQQGIKPFTSASPSVPPLNLAKYTVSQANRELPLGWPTNGFNAPNGLEAKENPFNGVKGYLNYKSQSSSPVHQHSTSQSHGQQLSLSHPSAESLPAKYGINGPFNAHSHMESDTGFKFHLHDNKLKNGLSSFAINNENKDLNLHLPGRLPNQSDLYQRKGPPLLPNESPTNLNEIERSLSGRHRNDTAPKSTPHSISTLTSSDSSSRSEGSMISEQKGKQNPAHIASSHAMPYYGSAEHTLSTSNISRSSTASSASNSVISQAYSRSKDTHQRDSGTYSSSSGASLASIQKANKIAADIYAEAQSSMMRPTDGSKLPSFSNVSNIVGNDKRHHGYDPYDFQSEERSVDLRPENNLSSAQRGPNGYLPLNYWSNFGTVTPNVSLEKRDDVLHRDSSVNAIGQPQPLSLNAPGRKNKEEESEKKPMSIKEMVEKKRNEKHKKKQASSGQDPNINQLVDAKVQEILAAYKQKELQKSQKPVKPISSTSTSSSAASSRSQHDNLPLYSDHAHHLNSSDPPHRPNDNGVHTTKSMDKNNPPGEKIMPLNSDNQFVVRPSSDERPLHQDSFSLPHPGTKIMPNRHDNQDAQHASSREIPLHQDNRDLHQPSSQDIPHRPDIHGLHYQSSRGIPNHHDNFGVQPPSSSSTPHHQNNDALNHPSSRDTPYHTDKLGFQHSSSRDTPNHQGNHGYQQTSSRETTYHPGNLGFQRPSPREVPNHSDNHGLHRPNSRNTPNHNNSPDVQRPNSRNAPHYKDNLDSHRPSSRDMPYYQDNHGTHPSIIPSKPVDHRGAYPPRYQHFYHQTNTQGIHDESSGKQHSENQDGYRPTPWDLQQQIMHMRLNRKEMLGQSSSEMHHQGLQPHGEENLSQQNDLANPQTKDEHMMALHKQVDQMRSYKKPQFDPHQNSVLDQHQLLSQQSNQQYHQQDQHHQRHDQQYHNEDQQHQRHDQRHQRQDQQHQRQDQQHLRQDQEHLRQDQQHLRQDQQHQRQDQQHQRQDQQHQRQDQQYHRQDQQYHKQDQQYHLSLQEQVQNMRNMRKEGQSPHQTELQPGMVPPWFENSKEFSVGHQSSERFKMSGNFVRNGLNLSMKKDPYEFDITSDKMNYQHPKMQFSDFNRRNGLSSNHGFLQGHYKARMNMEFDRRYMNRTHDPSLMDKNPLSMGQHKKIGSKPYGYKSSLSLLKKSQKYHGRSSLPIKKVGKLGRPLGRPPGKLSGKLKNKVTKDMFADNLMKNLGFPPLSKSDLISYKVPKMKLNFLNGHALKRGNPGILPQSQMPVKSEVKTENIWDKMDNIGNKLKNIDVKTDERPEKIKHSSEDIIEAAKKTRNKLQRSRSVECGLDRSCNISPIRRSKSVDDCQKLVHSEKDVKKGNMPPEPQGNGEIGGNGIDVDILTNQIKDLKKLVTGHLEDYSNNLETNTVVTVPKCGCLGPDYVFNEAVEGPYYTHLGAGRSVEAIRQILEKRTSTEGKAIRIEKVRYTGKEGKSSQGCPIAKWIIRRSSMEEKYLALIRHRPGHSCDTAWLMIGLVAWEGVPTNQADEMYSYLSATLPQNGFETERRCGTNDRKTCACQGIDLKSRGASFSFGCSWSMYFNGCKFARSQVARKFKLKNQDEEPKLEERLQKLATQIAPLYQQCAPQAHFNQSYFSEKSSHCRLGEEKPGPFSGVTACADFCAHAHKDIHNMNNGSTVVVTLTKHRGLSKPDDEQLHVLPLYVLEPTDENGSYDAQYDKIQSGALEVLHNYAMEARLRSQPLESCRKRRMNKKSPGKKGRPASMGRTSPWTGSTSSNQSTPKKLKQMKDMSYLHCQDSSQSFSSNAGSLGSTPIKQNSNPNCVTPIKQNFYPNGVYDRNLMPYGIYNGSVVPQHGQGSGPMANGIHNGNVLSGGGNGNQKVINVNQGSSVSEAANPTYTMYNAGNHGNSMANAAYNGNQMSNTVDHGNQMSNDNLENPKSSDGNFMYNPASHGDPKPRTHGNRMSDASNQGNQMPKSDNHRNLFSYTVNHGNLLSNPADDRNSVSADFGQGNAMSYAVNHGHPITDVTNKGNPMPNSANHGNLISNAVSHGHPMPNVASSGNLISNAVNFGNPMSNAARHENPMSNAASHGNPISNAASHGHPMPNATSLVDPMSNAASQGNPMSNAASHGNPMSNTASLGNPMSNAASHGNPMSNAASFGNPMSNAASHGNPMSNAARDGNSISKVASHESPMSYSENQVNPISNDFKHGDSKPSVVNHGNQVSASVNHENPVANSVNHENPVANLVQHGNQVFNSVNHENPVSNPINHGKPMSNSVNHGNPVSHSVNHGNPVSHSVNHGNPVSNDLNHGYPMSNYVNIGNSNSDPDNHRYRLPIATSHGTPLSDVKHDIPMSSVENQGIFMSGDVKYGNPILSDVNHEHSRSNAVEKESPIPYMVDKGNPTSDPVKYENPNDTINENSKLNDGNSVAINVHKGNITPMMDGNGEKNTSEGNSSFNVSKGAPLSTKGQDSNRNMPMDPTKVKDFHPGFEGLYDKFWNYFERNGSFPPPAFMAQYARARQMLLDSEAASNSENKSQQSVDVNHTENSENINVQGQTSSNKAPYYHNGHEQTLEVKQTDTKEMHNMHQGSLHRNNINHQSNAVDVSLQKQPNFEKQHNERFLTQDRGTTKHFENETNFIRNSLPVSTTNTSNGENLNNPQISNSQETEQTSVPHEQTLQAAQVSHHGIIQPSVKSNNSSQIGSSSQEGSSMESPQTSAIDLSSTTSNSKDLESASQHHLHESSNQEPLFQEQSNQNHSFHEKFKQKQHLHEEPHQRHQIYQGQSGNSDQQRRLPYQGHLVADQSHLSLLSEAVHNRTRDLETTESSSSLNLMRENKNVYNSLNGNTSEAKSGILQHNTANSVNNQFDIEKANSVTQLYHQVQAKRSKTPQYIDNVTGPFVGKKPLFTPYSFDHQTSTGTSEQNINDAHSVHFPDSNVPHDSGRSEYLKFHANEQKRNHISWNMFNYSQKPASHTNPSAMINGQSPIKEEMVEDTIDHDVIKCEMEYNEEAFRDPNIGGVAVALCHGAVLFEVAKRELHATTGLRHPNRYQPTRISLVFYQHKNLNTERHGMYAYAKKLENMKLERIAKMQEQQGFVNMAEIENSFKGGKKRKLEDSGGKPFNDEEEYDIMKTSAIHYKYMLECNAKREESLTTNSFMTNWVKPRPMVTGPFQKWV